MLNLNVVSKGRLSADDAAFVTQAETYEDLYDMMSNDLLKINSFFQSIHLQMSLKKTKFMTFRLRKNTSDNIFTSVHFDGEKIDVVDEFKYLRLIIDSNLTWKSHVNSLASKISPTIGVIRKIRYLVTKKVLMQLYYSYIHSQLIYCLPVWASCPIKLRMKLQRLQSKVIKYIDFKPTLTPTVELYSQELLSFEKLCRYESILLIHKIASGLMRSDLIMLTKSQVISRVTRQSNSIRLPQFIFKKCQDSCFYRGILEYNEFTKSTNVTIREKISEAKTKIKKFSYLVK